MTQLILDRTKPEPFKPVPLDAEQLKIVQHRSGAMRVLAGPGTGKTTTLVAAMAARLTGEDKLQPDQVLGLTFGRRAALDWRARVTLAVGGGLIPQVSTFHSFCYGLLRKYQPQLAVETGIRLLSGPEQQVRVRELFLGAIEDGDLRLPPEYGEAATTAGLIEEIRAVMSRTRSHLMSPHDLVELGKSAGRPMWELIGQFLETYLESIEAENALDYAEVIFRAHELLRNHDEIALELQSQYRAIFVDEYQDTDPGQVSLLKQLVTADTTLTVVGDVDQAIYGFRGADETGIRDFEEDFSPIYGSNIICDISLRNCRRFGANIRNAAKAIIGNNLPAGFGVDLINAHRTLNCAESGGTVELCTYDSEGAQAAQIANLIARAKAQDGLDWSDIAVIVRSATNSLPVIYRALVAAGIPVEVAADEIPLHRDPATAPLIAFLEVIAKPSALTPDVAVSLATGPIGQIDSVDLRRFMQVLRKSDQSETSVARPSGNLLVEAINKFDDLLALTESRHKSVIDNLMRIGKLISDCRNASKSGATAHEILWQIWQNSDWSDQLLTTAVGTGSSSVRANRDLDAICALFDQANRFVGQHRALGIRVFLEEIMAQEIPAEALADNQVRSNTVRLLTAHRAKGLEWPLVIVVGVQEDIWPDLRKRQTLLQADLIGNKQELLPTTTHEALVGERRLFYVALTRAEQRVVVTAVLEEGKDEGNAPSRFMEELRTSGAEISDLQISGRPSRPLSADAVVAGLRRILADPNSSTGLKTAVATRLAALAESGYRVLRSADPDNWWGVLPRTENPSNAPHEPVGLSASRISAIEDCPAKWFLEREVSAVAQTQNHMVFGTILHSLAQGLQSGELAPNLDALTGQLEMVWPSMPYQAPWISANELETAKRCATRLLNWFSENSDVRSIAETSLEFETTVRLIEKSGEARDVNVRITGSADRVQFNADGVMVYDYKTSKSKAQKIETNVQLALYSYLIENGTHTNLGQKYQLESGETVTGSALINLKIEDKAKPNFPNIQPVAKGSHDANSEITLAERITAAAQIVFSERYETRPGTVCRNCPVITLCPAKTEGRQVL